MEPAVRRATVPAEGGSLTLGSDFPPDSLNFFRGGGGGTGGGSGALKPSYDTSTHPTSLLLTTILYRPCVCVCVCLKAVPCRADTRGVDSCLIDNGCKLTAID